MSAGDAIVWILLTLGVALELVACLGVAAMKGTYDRLHFVAPSTLGAVLIATAVWAEEGPSMIGLKATLIVAFLIVAAPALAHATARAARISELGDWRAQSDEGIEMEER
jgi:monovalent cation/proton antiporter MnhG/PhaG subunit